MISRRNHLVYSSYLVRDGEQSLTRMTASTREGKWKGQSQPISFADLSEVADLLAEGVKVADLIVKQLAAGPGWHDPAAER